MNDLEPKEPGDDCNARKTDGSGYCGQPAGWGTDHTGVGRCRFHGGNTPDQERHVAENLEEAAEHAGIALRLRLKHLADQVENGGEIDDQTLDRLARTALDRTGHGPSETTEVTGEDGGPVEIVFNESVVETGYDE